MQLKLVLTFGVSLILNLGFSGLHAQEVIPTTGGNASGISGTICYTIGQINYTTYAGSNGFAAQGVQQPYEISTYTGIEEAKGITLVYSVYPIPAKEYVTLKIEPDIKNLAYQLCDISGKLLEKKRVAGSETNIDMHKLEKATYLLTVTQNNKAVKTFRIIKN